MVDSVDPDVVEGLPDVPGRILLIHVAVHGRPIALGARPGTRAVVVRTQRASVTASSFGPSPSIRAVLAPAAASVIPRSVLNAGSSPAVSLSSSSTVSTDIRRLRSNKNKELGVD